jgi:hypothetical protein
VFASFDLSRRTAMRALRVPADGAPPTLGDLPTPHVAPGQVLIKVKAAGLNPFDNMIAAGTLAGMVPHEYPLILGRDAAGVVEAVGDHAVLADIAQARQMGITGVPMFVFAGQYAVSGTQPAERFLQALNTAWTMLATPVEANPKR